MSLSTAASFFKAEVDDAAKVKVHFYRSLNKISFESVSFRNPHWRALDRQSTSLPSNVKQLTKYMYMYIKASLKYEHFHSKCESLRDEN